MKQDSGDPYSFTDNLYDFYQKTKNPKVPMDELGIIYCDGINSTEEAIKLANYGKSKGFKNSDLGIGTYLSNDFEHSKALNIVVKLCYFEGDNVYKISDSPGKSTKDV